MAEINDLINLAVHQGWSCERGGNHWKLSPPWRAEVVTISATASDQRAFHNVLADLRAAGLIYPPDHWKRVRRSLRKIERLREQRASDPRTRTIVRHLLDAAKLEGHAFSTELGVDAVIWLMCQGEVTGGMKVHGGTGLPLWPDSPPGPDRSPAICECGITFDDPSLFAVHCYDAKRKTHRFGHEPRWVGLEAEPEYEYETVEIVSVQCPSDGCSHTEEGESEEECWYAMTAHMADAHPATPAQAPPAVAPDGPPAPPVADDADSSPTTPDDPSGTMTDARRHALKAAESLGVLHELRSTITHLDPNVTLVLAVTALAEAQTAIALTLTQDPSGDDEKSG